MTRGYRDLVGLQVTFHTAEGTYTLTHFYQWKQDDEKAHVLSMKSYALPLVERSETIRDSLRTAYAPAVLAIWQRHEDKSVSEYLQFHTGAEPFQVSLSGEWTIVAEW